jgi:cytidine deaminase
VSAPPSDDAQLIARALAARDAAYAPYSDYHVGCALRCADGQVFSGVNIENASYPLTLCAERAAVAQAVTAGSRALAVVVVATQSSPPAAPCGMCRQTLIEFSPDPAAVRIILVNPAGERRDLSLAELFPYPFDRGQLEAGRGEEE